MKKNADMAILVYSCWKNRDMWRIFLKLFRKYWQNCPYRLILLTDKYNGKGEAYDFDDIVVCDSNWHDMIMAGIECAGTEYIMLWMDDYLLCDYIQNEDIAYYVEKARKHHAANLRLAESPTIPSKVFEGDRELNCYKPGTAYSFSTQVGIWNVDFLKKNMKEDWSAWDFERKGSLEVKDYAYPLLAARNYTFPYEEGVRRGKWMDNGIRLCQRNNIRLDFKKRKPMSSFELAWIYLKGGILGLNPTFIVKVQNFFQRLKG